MYAGSLHNTYVVTWPSTLLAVVQQSICLCELQADSKVVIHLITDSLLNSTMKLLISASAPTDLSSFSSDKRQSSNNANAISVTTRTRGKITNQEGRRKLPFLCLHAFLSPSLNELPPLLYCPHRQRDLLIFLDRCHFPFDITPVNLTNP